MAILWQKSLALGDKSTHYEVRSAGRTRRLYTNGVFHSQYNPASPVAGSVWDLLLLPAFFHAVGQVQRVLVLGVGGGAVIKQLEYFLAPRSIVGVELSAVHLQVAKKYFSVKGPAIKLYQADAIEWLGAYDGPKFDLIIDDLFGESEGEPCRAVTADESWCRLLRKHVAANGSVVMNFDTPSVLRSCYWLSASYRKKAPSRANWQQAYEFSTGLYSNCVALFTHQATTRERFTDQLQNFKELDARHSSCRLNYSLRKLF